MKTEARITAVWVRDQCTARGERTADREPRLPLTVEAAREGLVTDLQVRVGSEYNDIRRSKKRTELHKEDLLMALET